MSTRTARLGFFALSLASGLLIVRQVAINILLSRTQSSGDVLALTHTLDLFDYAAYALELGLVVGALAATQLPAAVRVRAAMAGIAVVTLVAIAIHVAQRTVVHGMTVDGTSFFKWTWAGIQTAALTSAMLAGLAIHRVGSAAGAKRSALVAGFATYPLLALGVLGLGNTLLDYKLVPGELQRLVAWTFELGALLQAVAFGWAGVLVGRIVTVASPEARATGAISARWRTVSTGIGVYLIALVVRIAVAGLLYATMRAAADAFDSYTRRKDLHDAIVLLGVIGALGGLVMIAGVFLIGRAPSGPVREPAIGAIVCMFIGLALDGWAISLSASAMNSVSDAFTAMDVLPPLTAITTSLGVIGLWAIFRALGAVASELALPDVERWARTGGFGAIVAGGFGAIVQIAIKGIPASIAVVASFIIVPAALFVAAQMLRVMLVVSSAIQGRSDPR